MGDGELDCYYNPENDKKVVYLHIKSLKYMQITIDYMHIK